MANAQVPESPTLDYDLIYRMWKEVNKRRAYDKRPNCSGVASYFVSSDANYADAKKVKTTLLEKLNIGVCQTNNPSVKECLAYFNVMKYDPTLPDDKGYCPIPRKTSKYRYIISYFSGYGGCDPNGEVYVYLSETTDKKVYIKWILSLLKERYNKTHPCILLFELYCHSSYTGEIAPCLQHEEENVIIAISGFKKEPPSCDVVSTWTAKLCEALEKRNIPLTDILDDIEGELSDQSPQHVSRTGTLFLYDLASEGVDNETLASKKVDSVAAQMNDTNSGVMLVVTSPNIPATSQDKSKILSTFQPLDFTIIEDDYDAPVDYNNILALIKAVTYYADYAMTYKFFAFYYSGRGGSDNGRAYIQLGDTDDQRIYLDWIVSLFSQKAYESQPCLLFFEMCSESDHDCDSLLLLPNCNKFLVATSGLNTAGVGRTDRGGKWTQALCDNIEKFDEPITTLLNMTQDQLPASQYINSAGLINLMKKKSEKDAYDYFRIKNSISTASNRTLRRRNARLKAAAAAAASPQPLAVLDQKINPLPKDVRAKLGSVSGKWREIGASLNVNEKQLKQIEKPDNEAKIEKLVKVIKKVPNKTWNDVIVAVTNVYGDQKAKEIERLLTS